MRFRLLMPSLICALVALVLCLDGTPGWSQGKGKGGKGKKGGGDSGGDFGGFGKDSGGFGKGKKDGGDFGGFGKGGKGKGKGDPTQTFERMSKGQGYITISEQKGGFSEAMKLFAERNGIRNDKLTLDQYLLYSEQSKTLNKELKDMGKGGFGKGGKGGEKGGKGGIRGNITDPAEKERTFNQMAKGNDFVDVSKRGDSDSIKLFAERIGAKDYKLNKNQYFRYLEEREKWDTEMRELRGAKGEFKKGDFFDKKDGKTINGVIVLTDVVYIPPVVYRPNNLPGGLPDWFAQFDKLPNGPDGQVSMLEWVNGKGSKSTGSLEEFARYDRNEDGLITVDEVLYFQRQGTIIAAQSDIGDITSTSLDEQRTNPGSTGTASLPVISGDGKTFSYSQGGYNLKMEFPDDIMKNLSPDQRRKLEDLRSGKLDVKSMSSEERNKLFESFKGMGGARFETIRKGKDDPKAPPPVDAKKR